MIRRAAIITILLLVNASAQDLAKSREFFDLIRSSQNLLAEAKPIEAEEGLIRWENEHPEIIKSPMFCYQRFFVALDGRGDRQTAKQMLNRLDELVTSGKLSAYSSIYRAATQAWNEALFHADSDLPRQAYLIMQNRLKSQAHP